jgi:oxygen-independent coproporphyrinogen III oxidase
MTAIQPPSVCFDSALIRRYDRNGPRYTSYPTAVQFHTGFGPNEYRQAAAACNDPSTPLSLYLHVPFCASPCFYCGCNKIITRDTAKAQSYLDYLYREIGMQASLFANERTVEQLHFGGGTPTFLSLAQLAELMDTLATNFHLTDSSKREYSIEIDPRTLTPESLPALARMGFNRLSLGVQDFDPDVQRAVNRVQSVDDTLRAITDARANGFNSVSVDLIYGLPKQTLLSFARTLNTILNARPDRLAVYGYAHMPRMFKAQRHINEPDLPSAATRIELLCLTIEKLTSAGYVYIGMDHFALPDDELVHAQKDGTLHRNFQGYSTRAECDLVALGVSSIGKLGNTYSQNAKTLPEYYAALDLGRLPVQRGIALNQDDVIRREVIQQIMCQGFVDFAELGKRFDLQFDDYFAAELDQLVLFANDGLITLAPTKIVVTPTGRLLLRNIAMVFDAYLPRLSQQTFSKAI